MPPETSSYHTRFAPSPTGLLHLGHAYAARIACEAAHACEGSAFLRIEDLDIGRARPDFENAILEDLSWLGLGFDPTVLRQSARSHIYLKAIDALEAMGLVYPCFCSRTQIKRDAALGGAPHADDPNSPFGPVYSGRCRDLRPDHRRARLAAGTPHALRLDMEAAIQRAAAQSTALEFFEAFAGGPHIVAANPGPAGDIVLARKDLGTSYHLAVVCDDAAQGITAVTRGEDLLPSTHIHVLLQRLLGVPTPRYGHHALVRDSDGKRLAKRADSLSIRHLRNAGATLQQVLALLPPMPPLAALTSR